MICPFEWRYGSEEMRTIFELGSRINYMVKVELALLKALMKAGVIPSCKVDNVRVDPEEVMAVEREVNHDIMALTIVLERKLGECGKYVHLGATSYDIVDTAWALQIRDALKIILDKLRSVILTLIEYSEKYRDLVMVGRTHGQWALPITLGFKFANYVYELARSYERLVDSGKRVVKLKMSGAVGTMAAWGERGLDVEKYVAQELGLEPHAITTQVAPRDGFAELISAVAILSSQLDRFALEVRELSRPEIGEIVEGVGRRQVGSSTMPHKANPVTAERISSLAKYLRALPHVALENIPLWHERDLTNSANERIIIPHAFLALDEQLDSTLKLLKKLTINEGKIRENLKEACKYNLAEALMIKLVLEKGLRRSEAHEVVMKGVREGLSVQEMAERYGVKIPFCDEYIGQVHELIERSLRFAKEVIKRKVL